ncbi:MAG: biopolymer transporter ExbD [Myxococcales bacterium]|nr:biopolymer transporter ExbD [Myxococcales bacterium]
MATIEVGGEAGGKKSVDSPIPLIPFIDLLLCCVMFLLVTAVWNQLASHDVSQQLPGQTTSDAIWEPEVRLVLQVTSDGYVVASTAGDRIPIPKNGDRYDVATLRERLQHYRTTAPNRRALTIAPDDNVRYEEVVQAMDVAAATGFDGLSLDG